MKKLTILFFTVMLSAGLSGQNEVFDFNEETSGEKQSKYVVVSGSYVVINMEGSVDELYQITRDWINESYKNPEKVIISDTKSKFLKINGYMKIHQAKYYEPCLYNLEFKFKENKIRVELSSISIYDDRHGSFKYSNTPKIQVWKKNGKLNKKGETRVHELEGNLNNLIFSLSNYHSEIITDADDW